MTNPLNNDAWAGWATLDPPDPGFDEDDEFEDDDWWDEDDLDEDLNDDGFDEDDDLDLEDMDIFGDQS
jgi:hypothetical protein